MGLSGWTERGSRSCVSERCVPESQRDGLAQEKKKPSLISGGLSLGADADRSHCG